MSSILQQLHDDDAAMLLMYLADELPTDERQQIDRRLDGDPELRQRLALLRDAQAQVIAGMDHLDDASELPVRESTATARAAAAIRQWQIERVVDIQPAIRRHNRYRLMGVYASAAVATIVIGISVWHVAHS